MLLVSEIQNDLTLGCAPPCCLAGQSAEDDLTNRRPCSSSRGRCLASELLHRFIMRDSSKDIEDAEESMSDFIKRRQALARSDTYLCIFSETSHINATPTFLIRTRTTRFSAVLLFVGVVVCSSTRASRGGSPASKGIYACTCCTTLIVGSTYVVWTNHDVSGRCAPDLELALITKLQSSGWRARGRN
jgi:hypothetical protein